MIKGKGLKIGLVGLGSMGQNYVRILSTLPGVNLLAVYDVEPAKAQDTSQKYSVPVFASIDELLAKVEAVCIVTPTKTHFAVATQCLSAGKHVILEKPFTGSSKTAQQLASLAKEKGVVLTVNFIERFNSAFIKLMRMLKNEKIHGLELVRYSPFLERISDTDVIFDMMIHDLDLLNQIIVEDIETLKAEGEKIRTKLYDRAIATISYQNGVIARVLSNRVFGSRTRKITATTEKVVFEADLISKNIYIRDFASPVPTTLPVTPSDQLTDMIKNFVFKVKGKRSLSVTPEEAIKDLELAERIKAAC